MNWYKIVSNAGLVFFTSLAAGAAIGSIDAFEVATIVAIIQAGIAFFTEMKIESNDGELTVTGHVQNLAKAAVLF